MQSSLFNTSTEDIKIVARHNDPETSHIAAKKYQPKAGSVLNKVLLTVKTYPGRTAGEYGEWTDLGHVPTQRCLSALCKHGLIVKAAPRKCNIKGSQMLTWEPV
jgi:hypothetical protein